MPKGILGGIGASPEMMTFPEEHPSYFFSKGRH
jgi:hypothetical protein